ncbi:MAG: AAA family ATPase [Saprospiraceae bacterium]|nr:AAA family ATPase [Saprospiraceae bacterium]
MENDKLFTDSKPSVIGYAQADFETLITSNRLYIDRTAYIRVIENHSNANLLFVRPRRFGKSLWLSILHYYYGVEHKDKFEKLFGNLAIGQHPTPLHNSFLILKFQFAGIDVETDASTFYGFRRNVLTGIQNCMGTYPAYFSPEEIAYVETIDTPANMIQAFFGLYKRKNIPHQLYILIDEYDQFANELVGHDTERFNAIIGRSGFVRKYYELIKDAANTGIVSRFFGTGVSPLTVDSLTSGFNITSSLEQELKFHDLMGFKRHEVAYILQQVGAEEAEIPKLITDLKEWYDGYLFNPEATELLYNSDMVMYFASHYEEKKKYPRKMLDANIATDYYKVKKIFSIQGREQEFIPILKELTTKEVVTAKMTDFFNLEKPFTKDDLVSLLYYMGWITIKDTDNGLYNFQMPNRVIKELYYDYFVDISAQELGLNNTALDIRDALTELARTNNPQPFLNQIKILLDKGLSLRDAQGFDEKHLKMLLIPYLSLSASHYVKSEQEWENGYPDLLLLRRPNITTHYNFIIELKYVKLNEKNKRVDPKDKTSEKIYDKVVREARVQLNKYIQTDDAKRMPNLKAWLIVLVGREWKLVEEIPVVF